jgi:hypothetical protein
MIIKIDVEGFEPQVLSGLSQNLLHQKPIVITEVCASHLRRAGQTPQDLFEFIYLLSYDDYTMRLPKDSSYSFASGAYHLLNLIQRCRMDPQRRSSKGEAADRLIVDSATNEISSATVSSRGSPC